MVYPRVLPPLLLVLTACAGARAAPPPAAPAEHARLTVVRGTLQRRLVLTGELRAVKAEELSAPKAPNWQLQIRWLAEDGARVQAGDKVVEFDDGEFAADLTNKRLQAEQDAHKLARDRAEAAIREAEKAFAVEQKRADVEKAKLKAAVPAELISEREAADRKLALRRAEVELEKAQADLDSSKDGDRADRELDEISLARRRREIATAEEAVRAATLTAPADGIFLVEDHPWEGRKLQEGTASGWGCRWGASPTSPRCGWRRWSLTSTTGG